MSYIRINMVFLNVICIKLTPNWVLKLNLSMIYLNVCNT
jgi:hypothetical protein